MSYKDVESGQYRYFSEDPDYIFEVSDGDSFYEEVHSYSADGDECQADEHHEGRVEEVVETVDSRNPGV